MIIGNSMNATYYKIYRRLDDSNEYERVSYFDSTEEFECDEDYEFVGYEEEAYVYDDVWNKSIDYNSDTIKVLVECDYCGKHFAITEKNRLRRAKSFRMSLRQSGKITEHGDDTLYKDNCKKCQSLKIKETTMLTKGYEHFSHDEESRKNWLENWNKAFALGGYAKSSKGQRYLADMFDGELNKPINGYFADIVIDNKIVIEYDGGGHNLSVLKGDISQEEFDVKEKKREDDLISKGYKIVRFVSHSEYFPKEEITKRVISEAIADLYLTDANRTVIKIGNKVNDPVYGKLKPIKKILETSEFGGEKE